MPSVIKRLSRSADRSEKTSPRSRGRAKSPYEDELVEHVPRPQVNSWLVPQGQQHGSFDNLEPETQGTNTYYNYPQGASRKDGDKSAAPLTSKPPHGTPGTSLAARGWRSPVRKTPSRVGSPTSENVDTNRPMFSLPSKVRTAPRIRYNRTPIRFAISGDWALKECEELTTWANDLLKTDPHHHEPPSIVDLRKSVGDGTTLVTLTEKVCGGVVLGIETDITCKDDRVHNIRNCLEVLQSVGVDAAGIDADDLADGNLKSSLLLVGNIRKHCESSSKQSLKGDGNTRDSTGDSNHNQKVTMPGIPLSGSRDQHPNSTEPVRKTYFTAAEDLIPGVMSKEEVKFKASASGNLISMTELNTNGASQHGVEERRQQILPTKGPRPHSAGSRPALPGPKPVLTGPTMPGSTTNAWAEGRQQGRMSGMSVEDQLKSLINSSSHTNLTQDINKAVSKSFDDGELLLPPPPQSNTGHPHQQAGQRYPGDKMGRYNNAYVPSQPDERWQGSRAEAILDRQAPPQVGRYRPTPGGQDNPVFIQESPVPINTVDSNRNGKPAQTGSELRNAWNKLYGRQGPPSRGVTPQPTNPYPQLLQQVKLPTSVSHKENTSSPAMPIRLPSSQPTVNASRTSPLGQSSSPMGHGSNSSGNSGINVDTGAVTFETFGKPLSPNYSQQYSPTSPGSPQTLTLGPSSKYPDHGSSRPSPARSKPLPGGIDRFDGPPLHVNQNRNTTGKSSVTPYSIGKIPMVGVGGSQYPGYHGGTYANSTLDSEMSGGIDVQASIFDYASLSEPSSRSVTPPLPPLSPSNSGSSSSSPNVSPRLQRSSSATMLNTTKTPDLLSNTRPMNGDRRMRKSSGLQLNSRPDKRNKHSFPQHKPPHGRHLSNGHLHSGILSDVKESGNDSDDPPFDIENTILTVESQDNEMLSMHEGLASHDLNIMRDKMNNLESMYQELMQALGVDKEVGVANGGVIHGGAPKRRWSIGSSDTSSLRRPGKQRPPRGSSGSHHPPGSHHRHHHYSHRDIKAINRRFQRLESHVVTLARSVAHLSSELRTHNAISHDLETIRREVREVKEQQLVKSHINPYTTNDMSDFERFRGWVPSLTNPKRVNKLTKFFGQEPPLLQFFLKQLGYEKYCTNFENEHIGMVELPYMTEDRLEKIGIPMGPRLRILKEAQLCFRQESFNIYIV